MKTLSHRLRRLAADFRLAMCRLNEIQFSAPWNATRSRCG
jgi:hypothetical protein